MGERVVGSLVGLGSEGDVGIDNDCGVYVGDTFAFIRKPLVHVA
jgi:hypothetical protein